MRELNKSIQQIAAEMAAKMPAVAVTLPDCPDHEGHQSDCWNVGYNAGFAACTSHIERLLNNVIAGLEGQVAS